MYKLDNPHPKISKLKQLRRENNERWREGDGEGGGVGKRENVWGGGGKNPGRGLAKNNVRLAVNKTFFNAKRPHL